MQAHPLPQYSSQIQAIKATVKAAQGKQTLRQLRATLEAQGYTVQFYKQQGGFSRHISVSHQNGAVIISCKI